MVPEAYHDYFAASVGAAGALVGLLFVAISLAPEQILKQGAPIDKRVLAGNAFTALLNAFFVSLCALLPRTNIGQVAAVVSAIGLVTSVTRGRQLFTRPPDWRQLLPRAALLAAGILVYGMELYCGIMLVRSPEGVAYVGWIASLLLGLFALGLARAWQLLGGRRHFSGGRGEEQTDAPAATKNGAGNRRRRRKASALS